MKLIVALVITVLPFTTEARIKNSQEVLGGLLTRAGVANMKPLDQQELQMLCEQGYTEAFFLYGGAADIQVSCSRGALRYRSAGDYRAPENIDLILNNINSGLRTREKTFIHCYNGAHASGFVAGVVLRTFCGISGDEAANYWNRTLGGYPLQEPNRSKLLNRLRNYLVRNELELSRADKARFGCP